MAGFFACLDEAEGHGPGADCHLSVEQRHKTDSVYWSVVGHFEADYLLNGWEIIEGAAGHLSHDPGRSMAWPFEQGRYA